MYFFWLHRRPYHQHGDGRAWIHRGPHRPPERPNNNRTWLYVIFKSSWMPLYLCYPLVANVVNVDSCPSLKIPKHKNIAYCSSKMPTYWPMSTSNVWKYLCIQHRVQYLKHADYPATTCSHSVRTDSKLFVHQSNPYDELVSPSLRAYLLGRVFKVSRSLSVLIVCFTVFNVSFSVPLNMRDFLRTTVTDMCSDRRWKPVHNPRGFIQLQFYYRVIPVKNYGKRDIVEWESTVECPFTQSSSPILLSKMGDLKLLMWKSLTHNVFRCCGY